MFHMSAAWPRTSSLIGKETLMLFAQPQRHQDTKRNLSIHETAIPVRLSKRQLTIQLFEDI